MESFPTYQIREVNMSMRVMDDRDIEQDHAEWQAARSEWFVLTVWMPLMSGLIIAVAMGVGIYYGLA